MLTNKFNISLLLLTVTVSSAIYAQQTQPDVSNNNHQGVFFPQDIKWQSGPSSLSKGAEIAVLEGDPAKEGPFTIRLKFPANYQIPPHFHPVIEHLTIISGTFFVGMGDKFDANKATILTTGSFMFMPPQTRHYAFSRDETVIQLHGVGPWGITYVNQNDDPRNKTTETSPTNTNMEQQS